MDFQLESFVLTKSGVDLCGQQRSDSRDGGARCAGGRRKESADAREIAGDVLREHQHSQRRRARGDRARWIYRSRRLRPTCRSIRSICRRCSRSRRNFLRRRWRRASSARRPTCRRISRAIISTCTRSRRASRSRISRWTHPHEKEKPVPWKNFSVAIGQFDLASRNATVTEVKSDGMHLFVRRARDGKLSLESLMRGAVRGLRRANNKREMCARVEANAARAPASGAQTGSARRAAGAAGAEFSIPGRFGLAGSDRRYLR